MPAMYSPARRLWFSRTQRQTTHRPQGGSNVGRNVDTLWRRKARTRLITLRVCTGGAFTNSRHPRQPSEGCFQALARE
jgi:hypothetical protein